MVDTIHLKVPLVYGTGYGHDGFSLSRALHQYGVDVRLDPTAVKPPVPMGVAQLLVKPLTPDSDFLIHHVDPEALGLTEDQKRAKNLKRVAWTMWEFLGFPEDLASKLTAKLDGYDLLLVYDEVSAQAFAPFAEEAGVPIKVLQGGYWSEDWKPDYAQRQWGEGETFRFCMAGMLGPRKNPFAAVHAFEEVHDEFPNTELHLKTNVQTLHPAMEQRWPGLKIHFQNWSHEQMRDFYATCHTYVATSWGEGKNLPALEAQTMGIPVIYSDFGGHRQWGSSDFGWPVSGTIEEHLPGMGSMRVDHDALVASMKEAVRDWQKTKRMGESASLQIPAMCDWTVVVRRLMDILHSSF